MDTKYLNVFSRSATMLLLTAWLVSILPVGVLAAQGDIMRASVDSSGLQANSYSKSPAISAGGHYVTFRSNASNLVDGDTNGTEDVFVHDRQTGATTRISVASSGAEANGYSGFPAISSDGRFITFSSFASNLISGDTNGMIDIFVHDRQTGVTTRVSVDTSGIEANGNASEYYLAISADGRYVTFQSEASNLVSGDTNGVADIFVHDRLTGATTRVSVDSSGVQANQHSANPTISSDGRFISFRSNATNLVNGDTNGKGDIFAHDRQTGQIVRVSISSSGEQANGDSRSPTISGDGNYIVFLSKSKNLVIGTEEYEELVYVHNRLSNETTLASIYAAEEIMVGTPDHPTISNDGHYIAFSFYQKGNGQGLYDIYVHNRQASETNQVTQGGTSYEDSSYWPSISGDGSIIAFASTSNTLISGDTNGTSDIFVYATSFTPPTPTPIPQPDLAPFVVSITQDCPLGCTISTDPIVNFTVTFSEAVTGVTVDDFFLMLTGDLSGTFVTEITGSGDEYIVAVNTGSGVGTLRLDVIDNDSILDNTDNPLGGVGAGNGNFNTGAIYNVDRSPPIATSILRTNPNPTSASNIHFTVNFSEAVIGVDASDFILAATGSMSDSVITGVSGSGNTYSVSAGTGSGNGTMRLDILDNDSITDSANNPLGGMGAGNGNFIGETYTIDKTAPIVTGNLRADTNPTTANSVTFTIGFTEAVSGVDASDFALTTTGDITGAIITDITGSANMYTISAKTGNGSGTLRLNVLDNDSITDALGNPLGGIGVGNGDFTAGEEYTINKVPVELITALFRSNGKNDGWVLESSENSNQGGAFNPETTTFALGDNAQNCQIRAILHFPTHYLPKNIVITRVLLMIKKNGLVGTNPFDTHQNILVDIRYGAFGYVGPFPYRGLQISDFQSPSSRDSVGIIENNPINDWYWTYLDSSAFEHINNTGITQIRLRFQLDDNDNLESDYLSFYSGDYNNLAGRPRLLVEYYKER